MSTHENPTNPLAVVASTPQKQGPTYTFTLPATARTFQDDPQSVTLRALTLEQDIMANKLTTTGDVYAKVEMAIAGFDGHPVDWGQGQAKARMEKMSPKCRELILAAFMRIHIPEDKEKDDFLASMKLAL